MFETDREKEITVPARLSAERDMDIDAAHYQLTVQEANDGIGNRPRFGRQSIYIVHVIFMIG